MSRLSRKRIGLSILIAVVILAAAAVVFFALVIAPMGTRYLSKRVCSGVFVSGLDASRVWKDELNGGHFGYPGRFGYDVDRDHETVTGTWFGIAATTSRFRPGLGCTPDGDGERSLPDRLSAEQLGRYRHPFPFPSPQSTPPALARALEWAFEGDSRTRAVVVVHDGRLIAEKYASGITRDTPLLGWSMNKSVMHALIGTQVLAGHLALDADHLFSEWTDDRAAITLEDLLHMSSGLAWDESYQSPFSDALQMLFARDDGASVPLAKPLAHPPGTTWVYSSGTTNLLALLLRRTLDRYGEDYLGYPHRALYDPLGMTTAVLEPDPSGTFVAASFGYASALDWARFGQLYLQDGVVDGERLLPEGWAKEACTPAPASPGGSYGGQFWLKLEPQYTSASDEAALPSDVCHAVGHEGQFVTLIPSRSLVIVRLGVNIGEDRAAGHWNQAGLVRRVLSALDPEALP